MRVATHLLRSMAFIVVPLWAPAIFGGAAWDGHVPAHKCVPCSVEQGPEVDHPAAPRRSAPRSDHYLGGWETFLLCILLPSAIVHVCVEADSTSVGTNGA